MRVLIFIWCIFFAKISFSQQSYSQITQQAFEQMYSAKTNEDNQKALSLFKKAFEVFPDSIESNALYKASVLSSVLDKKDQAFSYLEQLCSIERDQNGFPGSSVIVGRYSEHEYVNLLDDSRWLSLREKALDIKSKRLAKLEQSNEEFAAVGQIYPAVLALDARDLYVELKKDTERFLVKEQRNYSVFFDINDTLRTSFFIHLPIDYDPNKKYALLVFLHGAVRHNALSSEQTPEINLGGWNRFYTKYAQQDDVILVFPKGSKQFNWMTPDDGFYMLGDMIKKIKQSIHIDDNKVFISGHSNGATGSFSYLMKQPTLYAGFFGFNTHPKVYTGGTFVENIKNRNFTNFSTDLDYYYPPQANDDLVVLMQQIQGDYEDYRYNGFPHWFPEFDESEPAYKILFKKIKNTSRNAFPKQISWEYDDQKYNEVDWISDIQMDTLQKSKPWHNQLNFKINTWLYYSDDPESDELLSESVDISAFDFPRCSAKVTASYSNNEFHVQTSRVSKLSINISPQMIDINKKVRVYINNRLCFDDSVDYDKEFMLNNYRENLDREQLWVNQLIFEL